MGSKAPYNHLDDDFLKFAVTRLTDAHSPSEFGVGSGTSVGSPDPELDYFHFRYYRLKLRGEFFRPKKQKKMPLLPRETHDDDDRATTTTDDDDRRRPPPTPTPTATMT